MSKRIQLTHGAVTVVDDEDYEWLNASKWHLAKCRQKLYAMRAESRKGGRKQINTLMHRMILGLARGDGLQVDHVNGDGLDNRRSNLRLATQTLNNANAKGRSRLSRFKGVEPPRNGAKRWAAKIKIQRKTTHLGYFSTEEDAARAYDSAAARAWGKFARLNFPEPRLVALGEVEG